MSPKPDVSLERRSQIYQAALACFNRRGYHLTTMDDIALESGLSKGALYWYFESKKTLFLGMFQEMMDQMSQTWAALIRDQERTATEKLLDSMAFFRTELEEMVPFFGIMMEGWTMTRHDQDVENLLREMYAGYQANMAQIIREGQASGDFAADLPEATPLVVLALYDGVVLALATGLGTPGWGTMMDAVETLVLNGLKAN